MIIFLLVTFITSTAVSSFLMLQIRDEIEAGLPIKDRESWRLWQTRRFPLKELRLHRDKFPASRLRMLWIFAILVSYGCVIGPLIVVVLRSAR